MHESTHPSLLVRVKNAGDDQAWRTFDARYGPLILGYCRRLGMQLNDAEDVRQVVLSDLAKALSKFEFRPEIGRFRTYLGRVVRNAATRHLQRKSSSHHSLGSTVLATTSVESAEESDALWEQQWILHHYRVAMKELEESCDARSLDVFQSLVEGLAISEVANQFGMSPEAVRKVKQRIKERLRTIVARQLMEEDYSN